MYLLEIDREKNRLHITLSGSFDEAEAWALLSELQSRFEELGENFNVLSDLAQLENFDKAARPYYRKLMDLCNRSGARKVVRIIPNPLDNFGLTIMSNIHYDSSIPVITCRSLREALTHL